MESGAGLEVMKRRVGRSAPVTATARDRSMLMTAGIPTATVTPYARPQSKNRARENFRASTSVAPVRLVGPVERVCREDQPKGRAGAGGAGAGRTPGRAAGPLPAVD